MNVIIDHRIFRSMALVFLLCSNYMLHAQVMDTTIVEGLEKPGFVESDLNNSLSKKESLFKGFITPDNYNEWKTNLYHETKFKFSASYQANFMQASNTIAEPDHAASGSMLLEAEWTPLNYDEDFQGGLIFSYNNIHPYGNAAQPPLFQFLTGSMFSHDAYYIESSFIPNLYWEQWFKKDRFFIRIGQHVPASMIDFSRFADVRTSASNPAMAFPAGNIPFGPPAFGLSAKLLPLKPTGFYFVLHASDVNSVVDEINIGTVFETGDVFVAGEIGHNWFRMVDGSPEFDHLHLLVYGGSAPSRRPYPASGGWGFKIAGEKQFGPWIGIFNYAYNTSSGGGFGFTELKHVINIGGAYRRPFGIRGEAYLAFTWGQELDKDQCGLIPCEGRDQTMMEAYWKILVFPQFWLSPGFQAHFKPVNNPDANTIWLPMVRFRFFL